MLSDPQAVTPPVTRRILVVEDSEGHAMLVRNALGRSTQGRFEIEHEVRLDRALARLEESEFDAMLLDLGLPDGYGLSTIGSACSLANHLPVVVLTGTDDESLAIAALRAGAQDYLVKDAIDYGSLPTTILRAIERHGRSSRALEYGEWRSASASPVSLRDPLTGLVSDALLWDRLDHAVHRAARRRSPLAVAILRYSFFGEMRECFGDDAVDALLCAGATQLQTQVRRSDTLARHGHDAFVLILEDAMRESDTERLVAALLAAQTQVQVERQGIELNGLVPSVGLARFPDDGRSPEALLSAAEAAWRDAACVGGGIRYAQRTRH